ncbi:hypothetical protein [Litorimonas sp.]|uniref:hypothetical protein n=1 Tax=Litorimonas sp. TaxID=1892381 RepID=UPI003A86B6F4
MEFWSEITLLIVGALIALLSSILTAYFSHKNQAKTQKAQFEHEVFQSDRQRKVQVAEELYGLFSK